MNCESTDGAAPRLFLAAVVYLGGAWWKYSEVSAYLEGSKRAHASVIEDVEIRAPGITHIYRSSISYRPAGGKDWTLLSPAPSYPAEFPVGDAVDDLPPRRLPVEALHWAESFRQFGA